MKHVIPQERPAAGKISVGSPAVKIILLRALPRCVCGKLFAAVLATFLAVAGVGFVIVTLAEEIVPAAVVNFENDYTEYHTGGHGITNNFSFDGVGGWTWNQVSDNVTAQ